MLNTTLMTCPKITLSSLIKGNVIRIMLVTSFGIYCQIQTQHSIFLLKLQRMIGTQKHKFQQEN